MKSKVISIRLSSDELAAVKKIMARDSVGLENVSEVFRWLLWHECYRRVMAPPSAVTSMRTAFRNGRPKLKGVL